MRVTDIEISFGQVNFLNVAVQGSSTSDRFLIKTVIGLDADEIVSKFYGFSTTSRTRQYSVSLPKREIVMRIVLNPTYANNETVEEIRDRLYRIISADRSGLVTLVFRAEGASMAKISGFLTKFEVPHFSKEPELQLTIRCDDPMFRSIGLLETLDDALPDTDVFNLSDTTSNAPHGFEMGLTATAISSQFLMQDVQVEPEWKFQVIPESDFAVGDQLKISTTFGDKQLDLIPNGGGSAVPLVDRVSTDSYWPLIFPGANPFWIENLSTNWTVDYIQYYATFWGV